MTDYLKDAERAVKFLADSEAEWAALKSQHQALDKRRKIIRASGIMDSLESSATMNANDSESSPDYLQSVNDWEQAMSVAHSFSESAKNLIALSASFR